MTKLIQLHTFVEVVRAGGFSAAARTIGIPRSTVSLHVKTLESSLGVRLLKRSTRSISLTEEGEQLYNRSKENLDSLNSALELIRDHSDRISGLIRITAPADFPTEFLARAITEFSNIHPDVRFEIILTNTSLGLASENIDIAIGFSQRSDGDRVQKFLLPITWEFYANSNWLEKNGMPKSIDQISDFISPGRDLCRFLEQKVLDGQKLPKGTIEANNHLLIRDLVLQGAGVGLLPIGMLDKQVEEGFVKAILDTTSSGVLALSIEFPSRADITQRVRKFADHFSSLFRSHAPGSHIK